MLSCYFYINPIYEVSDQVIHAIVEQPIIVLKYVNRNTGLF